eukprot:gene701-1342_t
MSSGSQALHKACLNGDITKAQALLNDGADRNSKNSEGLQPIHCACIGGNLSLVQLLLSQGAQLNSRDDTSMSPLHYACSSGHLDVVAWLMSQKVFKNNRNNDGMTPLLCACANGHLPIVQLLISEKVFDFATNKDGNSALHLAYLGGHAALAEWLIQYGMDAEAKNKEGKTPVELLGQSRASAGNTSSNTSRTRRDETFTGDSLASPQSFDMDSIESKRPEVASKAISSEKQEKAEARRRALAQARAETEEKLRVLSNPSTSTSIPSPKNSQSAIISPGKTSSAFSKNDDQMDTKTSSPPSVSVQAPITQKITSTSTSGNASSSKEKQDNNGPVPVRFRIALDTTKKVFSVYIPMTSSWEIILEAISTESKLVRPDMIRHLLLYDKDDDELSPFITTGSKFWRYAESFRSDIGMVFVVYSNEIIDLNKDKEKNSTKMIRARLASDLNQRTAVSISNDCTWEVIVQELSSGLGLGSSAVIRHLVLIDSDGDELSPPLQNGSKFWKYGSKYYPDQGMYFVVYVDNIEKEPIKDKNHEKIKEKDDNTNKNKSKKTSSTGASSSSSSSNSNDTGIIYARMSYDSALDARVHVVVNSSWDEIKNAIATAIASVSASWISHIVMVDEEGDVLCHEINSEAKFWKYYSKFKQDDDVIYIIHVDENRREKDIQQYKLEITRAASKLFKVKLYSISTTASYDVYLLPDCSWEIVTDAIATSTGSINSDWISHLILMDADGDILSPSIDNTSKFWKIGSKYKADDNAAFVVHIDENKKAESLRLKAIEEARAASKHITARLAKESKRPIDVYIPYNCDWKELTCELSAALGFEDGSFVHHLVLMDSEGDVLTPSLINAPQFWKISAKYKVDEGSFFVIYEDEAIKAEFMRKKAMEEILAMSIVFHIRLAVKGSKKIEVRIPHDCAWDMITKIIGEGLSLSESSIVHHLVLIDADGDVLSPDLSSALQFWKFGSRLRTDDDSVFVVYTQPKIKSQTSKGNGSTATSTPAPNAVFALATDPSRRFELFIEENIDWDTLSETISTSLNSSSASNSTSTSSSSKQFNKKSISHIVLVDEEGDEMSPALNNSKIFQKYASRYQLTDGNVFHIHLLENKQKSDEQTFRFILSYDHNITNDIKITSNSTWDDIIEILCNSFDNLTESQIQHVMLVDTDGDNQSPALDTSKKFWKYAGKYEKEQGASFMIYADKPKSRKATPTPFDEESVYSETEKFKRQQEEEVEKLRRLQADEQEKLRRLQADAKQAELEADRLRKLQTDTIYAELEKEKLRKLQADEMTLRMQNELDEERQRRIRAQKETEEERRRLAELDSYGALRQRIDLEADIEDNMKREYNNNENSRTPSRGRNDDRNGGTSRTSSRGRGDRDNNMSSTGDSPGSRSTSRGRNRDNNNNNNNKNDIKQVKICIGKHKPKVTIDIHIESTWEEFRQIAASALRLKDPLAIQYVVLVDGDGEDHGPHIKGMSKLFKYHSKYELDTGMAFVLHFTDDELLHGVSESNFLKSFHFLTSDRRNGIDISLDEQWSWEQLTNHIASNLALPPGDPIYNLILIDNEGDSLSPEIKSASRFWKYAFRHMSDHNISFIAYQRSTFCQRVRVCISSESSVQVDIYIQFDSEWEEILRAVAEGLGGIKTNWIHHLQLMDLEVGPESPEIDNAMKFWKYGYKSVESIGKVMMIFMDEAALEAEVAGLEMGHDDSHEHDNISTGGGQSIVSSLDDRSQYTSTTFNTTTHTDNNNNTSSSTTSKKPMIFTDAAIPKSLKVRLAGDRSRLTDVTVEYGCQWDELSTAIATGLGTFKPAWMESITLMDEDDYELSPEMRTAAKFWNVYNTKYNSKSKSMIFVINIKVSDDDAALELIKSCSEGDLPFAKRLVQMGSSIVTRDDKGFYIIHHAAMSGQRNIVEWLVSTGVSIDLPDPDGMTPLHHASNNSFEELITTLVDAGANILAKNKVGLTPIHYICLRGLMKKTVLIRPHLVNLASSSGLTLLHCSCDGGKYEMVKYLLTHGAHVHSQDCEGLSPLHYACLGGHLDIAKLLVENSAYWNTRDDEGMAPLHYACVEGHVEIAQWLVSCGASLTARNDQGNTALHLACESGNVELVSWLIGKGMDISLRNKIGFTPLHCASEAGNTDMANYLCAMGAQMTTETPTIASKRIMDDADEETLLRSTESEEEAVIQGPGAEVPIYTSDVTLVSNEDPADSTLRDACARGDLEIVRKMLLGGGGDVHSQNINGSNCLHFACIGGHLELAEMLLAAGAVLDSQNLKGFAALHLACDRKHPKLALWLVLKGANINLKNAEGYTPLHYVCIRGLTDVLNDISKMRSNFDANMTAHKDISLLHCAAEQGHETVIEELVHLGALVDSVDADNKTPLHYACLRGHLKAIKCLVEHEAHVNARDYRGSTPLFYACSGDNPILAQWLVSSGNLALSRWLIESGVDIRAKNKKNLTPMDFATKGGFSELVEYLNFKLSENADYPAALPEMINGFHSACSAGNVDLIIQFLQARIDPNVRNDDGTTALHYACLNGLLGVVRRLVSTGAKINNANEAGLTPFHCAVVNGHLSLAQWLVQQGANPLDVASFDNTALHFAAQSGHLMIVDWLLRSGLEIDATNSEGLSVLYYAVYSGHTEVVKLLLKNGADIDLVNKMNETVMHAACAQGRLEIAQLLVENDAEYDEPDRTKMTPFMYACWYGHLLVARWLTSLGVRIDFVGGASDRQNSALHLACQNGHTDIAIWLIELGLNPSAENAYKASPILYATSSGHGDLAQWLTQRGALYFEEWMREGKDGVLDVALKKEDYQLARELILDIIETSETSFKIAPGSTPLHFAAAIGHVDLTKELVALDADINAETVSRMTPMHFAAVTGHKNIAIYLMSLGAKVNVRDQSGSTPLTLAMSNGHTDLAQFLKANGATVGGTQTDTKMPKVELEQSYLLIPHGFSLASPKPMRNSSFAKAMSDLCLTVSKKDLQSPKRSEHLNKSENNKSDNHIDKETIRIESKSESAAAGVSTEKLPAPPRIDRERTLLFGCMPNLAATTESSNKFMDGDGDDNTDDSNDNISNGGLSKHSTSLQSGSDFSLALHEACVKGDIEAVTSLIEGGASVNAPNPNGLTSPIHIACAAGNMSLTQLLVKKGAKIGAKNSSGMSPLHIVCDRQNPLLAIYLVKKGADLSSRNKSGETPMHKMCHWGMDSLLRQILGLPRSIIPVIDLEVKTDRGLTPLHCAVDQGFLDVVQILLEQRVEVNCRDENNRTPLHYACLKGYPEIIDQLVVSGAFINCRDNQGLSPLLCACAAGHLPLAKWLVENGANVFSETELGNNALHVACKAGNLKMAQWLLSNGLNANERNTENMSPLQFAQAGNHAALVNWLIERGGADANISLANCPVHQRARLSSTHKARHNPVGPPLTTLSDVVKPFCVFTMIECSGRYLHIKNMQEINK